MKIALLSGALKNAGDYLIVERSKLLLKNNFPNCTITEYDRSVSLESHVDDINKHDVMVVAGGPGYLPNVYPHVFPLVDDLEKIKTKLFILGMGWKAADASSQGISNYIMTNETKAFLRRVEDSEFKLGCRDLETVRALKRNGFSNTIMTGCPAWYNLEYVDLSSIRNPKSEQDVRKIYISDPKAHRFNELALEVVSLLKLRFPDSEFVFVFHKGMREAIASPLKNMGVKCLDISESHSGFEVYNDSDLHVGFRVHAHIHNLSVRNASILIEEDSRGAGVNNTLGLQNIVALANMFPTRNRYINKILSITTSKVNQDCLSDLADYLDELYTTNCFRLNQAFYRMKHFYKIMNDHIQSIAR